MLMHKGIGLDRFNTMAHARAVYALFEICGNVTWAATLADARPYPDRDALLAKADIEVLALSRSDLYRALDSIAHEQITQRSATELTRVVHDRIDQLLGPAEGYPEY